MIAPAAEQVALERFLSLAGWAPTRTGPGWTAVRTGARSNDLNGVVSTGPIAPDTARDLVAWFTGVPATWRVALVDDALTALLVGLGAQPERTGQWCGRALVAGDPVLVSKDLDAWLDVAGECGWFEADDRPLRLRVLEAQLASPSYAHWVLRRDGIPVAMASAYAGSAFEVTDVAVAPPYRRRGLGAVLLGAASAWGAERGHDTVVAAPSPDGARLFEAQGFAVEPVTPDPCFYSPDRPSSLRWSGRAARRRDQGTSPQPPPDHWKVSRSGRTIEHMFEAMRDEARIGSTVLDDLRTERATADRAEARLLDLACEWAEIHPADSIDSAAVLVRGGDSALAIAGDGAPLVSEFAIAEYAAALRLPTRVGKERLGLALELKHRLPKVWARTMALQLPAWRARRIAEQTMGLSFEAAAYVDSQIAPFAHKVGPAETERLVADATARFMPDLAEKLRREAADGRHVDIGTHSVSFQGTTYVRAEMDLADALDLETAVAAGAASLAEAGSEASLDVRRSMALGDLARGQEGLDLSREVVLHVHLSPDSEVVRVEAGGSKHLLTAEQIRLWCHAPHAKITVKPVIDLNTHISVDAYEIPDRLHHQVQERDGTCVFPWCTRTARACDTDHVIPYDDGGETASDNLAALCRSHHRLKTHGDWTYTILEPGSYLWRSPHGLSCLRDGTGTQDLSRPPPVGD